MDIVPVHIDIEATNGNWTAPDPRECLAQAAGEVNAAALHADQDHLGRIPIPFHDFVRDALQGAVDGEGIKDLNLYFRRHKTD
jgi:hypothetical protein